MKDYIYQSVWHLKGYTIIPYRTFSRNNFLILTEKEYWNSVKKSKERAKDVGLAKLMKVI